MTTRPGKRRAGVCLHFPSLPGRHGIGDLGHPAVEFLDWMRARDLGVWQFLPLGPTAYGNSPYQPLSVFAGDPLLISLDRLVDWGLLRRSEVAPDAPCDAARVDYGRVTMLKKPALDRAAARLLEGGEHGLTGDFEAFCTANDDVWLDDYAAFTVLKARHGGVAWTEWPGPDAAGSQASIDALRADSGPLDRTKAIQFFFFRQWETLRDAADARGIRLFGDLPIYLALDSAESWSRPDLLLLDERFVPTEVAGVPPDYFSADGQLWGNPIYDWERHAARGFAWWIARVRHMLELTDMIRLDHFRGFDEYWSVPQGALTARDGQWHTGPGRALFDALTGALPDATFVAEDLGIITESVTALRKAYSLPGMQVLQFLVDRVDFDSGLIDEDCVCYTGTHDNDTSEGWFAGSAGHVSGPALEKLQMATRHNIGDLSEIVHKGMISLAFKSPARLAIAPLQDYLGLGSSARLNVPGQPEGNWQWRVERHQLGRADLDWIGELVARYDRT